MKVICLQSGSNGNSTYVEAGGVRLLVDAGISARQAQLRLAAHGRDLSAVDAVLISHEHADHVRGLGVYQQKFGLTTYATRKTFTAVQTSNTLCPTAGVEHFVAGGTFRVGQVTVETIPTPHDSVDGVAFVVDDGRRRLGILTDLGHVFAGLDSVVGSLDAVVIESNYDPGMLERGPYPWRLKQRIQGPGGHLSNVEAAELLATANGRLKWACLAHLSARNNAPHVARDTHETVLGKKFPLHVASRTQVGQMLEV